MDTSQMIMKHAVLSADVWLYVVLCGVFGMLLTGCGGTFHGVPAEYWQEGNVVPYTSYPGLIATPWPPEGDEVILARHLIDSLGLEDVSAFGSMSTLRRKDGKPFDRMNSPELGALRAHRLRYGPIVAYEGGQVIGVFSTKLFVLFGEGISAAQCDSVVRSWNPASSVHDGFAHKFIVDFPDEVGEGMVDIAARAHANPHVVSVAPQVWKTDIPFR